MPPAGPFARPPWWLLAAATRYRLPSRNAHRHRLHSLRPYTRICSESLSAFVIVATHRQRRQGNGKSRYCGADAAPVSNAADRDPLASSAQIAGPGLYPPDSSPLDWASRRLALSFRPIDSRGHGNSAASLPALVLRRGRTTRLAAAIPPGRPLTPRLAVASYLSCDPMHTRARL